MSRDRRPASERILEAVDRLFLSCGDRFTMRQVAQEAQVSRATVHSNFPNKDTLLAAMLERGLRDINDLVPDPSDDLRSDLISLAGRFQTLYSRNSQLFHALPAMSNVSSLQELIASPFRRMKNDLIALLITHKERGHLSPLLEESNARQLAEKFVTMFLGGLVMKPPLTNQDSEPLDAEEYVDLFLQGYGLQRQEG